MSEPFIIKIDPQLSPRQQIQPYLATLETIRCPKHQDVLLPVDEDGSIREALREVGYCSLRQEEWQFSPSIQSCDECKGHYFSLPPGCAKLQLSSKSVPMGPDTVAAAVLEKWKSSLPSMVICHRPEPGQARPVTYSLHSSTPHYKVFPFYRRCHLCTLEDNGVPPLLSRCSFDNFICSTPLQQEVVTRCRQFARKPIGFLFLVGSVGAGKTHLAVSVMREAVLGGRMCFLKFADLLAMHRSRFDVDDNDDEEPPVTKLRKLKLLVLDELRLSGGKDEEPMLFDFVNYRCEHFLPTIITTNVLPAELEESLGSRTVDRIRQAAFATLGFNWESHRPAANAAYLERAALLG
jgi:DNA replication protein DnaC